MEEPDPTGSTGSAELGPGNEMVVQTQETTIVTCDPNRSRTKLPVDYHNMVEVGWNQMAMTEKAINRLLDRSVACNCLVPRLIHKCVYFPSTDQHALILKCPNMDVRKCIKSIFIVQDETFEGERKAKRAKKCSK